MKKSILLVLMGLNALMQAGGGTMMLTQPGKMARELFHVAGGDAERLIGVIGAATLAFMVLSVTATVLVLRDERAGYDLSLVLGVLLGGIGVALLATGFSCGNIDVVKGLVLALAAATARAARAGRASPVRAPASSRLRAS
ncbi:MAG TPA: hypothetical protein VHB79_19835 [Polyangiaceae bacterium]|nr:hypothetical protein [Polyangiaceae bacterium]